MTIKNIVVPLDGSPFAEAALPYAVRLARSAHARLHLVLAHEPVAALVGMGDSFPPPDFDEDTRGREKAYLAETTAELVHDGTTPVEFRELEGPAGLAICEEATRLGAELVVMSTHGRGTMGRLWLGSVADYVVRHLGVPVLLIHPGKEGTPPPEPALHRILVPLDLSRESEAVLDPVVTLAQLTEGHATLLHVVEPILGFVNPVLPYPATINPALLEENRTGAQHKLDRIADGLREKGLSVNTRVSSATSAAEGLLEVLGERFDLIAMTTHGRGGIKRLLLGSVADKVIRGAAKPVLVVRPSAA